MKERPEALSINLCANVPKSPAKQQHTTEELSQIYKPNVAAASLLRTLIFSLGAPSHRQSTLLLFLREDENQKLAYLVSIAHLAQFQRDCSI